MAVFEGELLIYIEEGEGEVKTKKPLAYNKTASLSVKHNTKEVVTKEDGEWSEKLNGRLNWTASADGTYCLESGTQNKSADTLFDALIARKKISIIFGLDTKTATYKGNAYISSWDLSSGADEIPTYSISLEGSGPLVKTALV